MPSAGEGLIFDLRLARPIPACQGDTMGLPETPGKERAVAFVCIQGLPGRVYVPEVLGAGTGKHPCRDCFVCQRCGASRCRSCSRQAVDPDPEALFGPCGRETPGGRGCDG